jgi:hypothetical protein
VSIREGLGDSVPRRREAERSATDGFDLCLFSPSHDMLGSFLQVIPTWTRGSATFREFELTCLQRTRPVPCCGVHYMTFEKSFFIRYKYWKSSLNCYRIRFKEKEKYDFFFFCSIEVPNSPSTSSPLQTNSQQS